MYLSVHTCAGAVIGRFSPNPIVAFLLGLISHFIMDIIPHGDLKIYDRYKKGRYVRHALAITLLDGMGAIYLAMLILVGHNKFGSELNIAAGIVGATIPDVFAMLYEITRSRFLKWIHSTHFYIHRIIANKKEVPYIFGVFYQFIILSYLLFYIQAF